MTTAKTFPSSIRIANAPCSWGVLEFDLPGKALGYAQVLDEIKADKAPALTSPESAQ